MSISKGHKSKEKMLFLKIFFIIFVAQEISATLEINGSFYQRRIVDPDTFITISTFTDLK